MFTTRTQERVRYYVRRPGEVEPVATGRDVSLLLDLHRFRLMHTAQLQALYGPRVMRRLRLLFSHGYVDRPAAQRVWRLREGGGSRPLVYALGDRGLELLRARSLVGCAVRDMAERNRGLSMFSMFIPHTLDVSGVHVAFRRSVAERPDLRLVHADELAPAAEARSLAVPGHARPLVPDLVFALSRTSAREPSLFFVEVDRATEPNLRHGSPDLQSLARKYEGYLAYARAKRHLEQFGIGNFRVLTVTTGGERKVRNLAETAREVANGDGADRFLATSMGTLEKCGPLEAPWWNAAGQGTALAV